MFWYHFHCRRDWRTSTAQNKCPNMFCLPRSVQHLNPCSEKDFRPPIRNTRCNGLCRQMTNRRTPCLGSHRRPSSQNKYRGSFHFPFQSKEKPNIPPYWKTRHNCCNTHPKPSTDNCRTIRRHKMSQHRTLGSTLKHNCLGMPPTDTNHGYPHQCRNKSMDHRHARIRSNTPQEILRRRILSFFFFQWRKRIRWNIVRRPSIHSTPRSIRCGIALWHLPTNCRRPVAQLI
mmetsp:Transcript_33771/g.99505  ORF Transcript_33771/g.99505 Transcript_33771/m.99505 type:complete len:230 (+) Transcript_33771:96-785(+)